MSQYKHLRCDRCTNDELFDSEKQFLSESGWAHVEVGRHSYDLCPNCWNEIVLKEELVRGKGRAE